MDRDGNGEAAALMESDKLDAGGEAASVGEKRPGGEADSVGEKRQSPTGEVENGEDGGLDVGSRATKRLKKNSAGEMRQVAEMVLVLSGMGQMRGGRDPTEAEVKLMVEAREKLVEICQRFAPKELVAGDAVGKVIDDLGLNWKLNDQRLGFRGSRMSLKEKVAHAKRKMEEPKKVTTHTTHASQTSHPSFTVTAEGCVPTHTVRPLLFDKPTHAPLPSGSTPGHHPPFTHVSGTASSGPVTYLQASNAEVKGTAASVRVPINHVGGPSVVAAPRGQFIKVEGGPNANTYTLNANAPLHHPQGNAPTWSLQPSSLPSKMAAGSKVPNHTPVKAESGVPRTSLQASRDQAFRPPITQTAGASLPSVHQPTQTVKAIYYNHSEIAKVVQKLLQPKLPEHPTWIPPSREYMNKALSCQSCNLTINEVDNVVICDACEKGFHVKCLESVFQKAVPRTEWHCMKCTSLSNGKPFPPKYGRVTRSMTPPKGPASATQAGAQSLSDKKLANMGQKGDQDKMSSVLESVTDSGTAGCVNLVSGTKIGSERGVPGNSITSKGKDTGLVSRAGTLQVETDSKKPPGPVHDSAPVALSGETYNQQIQASGSPIHDKRSTSEPKPDPPTLLSNHIRDTYGAKPQQNVQDVAEAGLLNAAKGPSATCQVGTNLEESKKTFASGYDGKKTEEGDVQAPFPSSHDEKQSEVDGACTPASEHDVKQSAQGVAPASSASEQDVKQGEQCVVPAPSALEQNVKQSEHGDGYAPSASEQNAEQRQQGVGHAPSASEHNDEQVVGHVPSALEQNVNQREQGASSASAQNAKQSEHGVGHGPSASEHNVKQSEECVAPAPCASEYNAEQSQQGVAHAPSSLEEISKEIEQGGAHSPSSEYNVMQTEQGVSASEHNIAQSEQDVAPVTSASEHDVEHSEHVVAQAPSFSEHNVEQHAQGAACAPLGSEHKVQQSEQGVDHVPSASEDNIEQSEIGVAHAGPAKNTDGSSNNVQLSPKQGVARAPLGSEHKVQQSEQGVDHLPSASEDNIEQSEIGFAHTDPAKNTDGSRNNVHLSPEVLQTVEWVGSALKVVDDKSFYESCCIGGVVYNVLDHALFRSSHGRLIPSKLQSMWEDMKTGSKWVTVSRCYLREDLPEGVGQPFSPESNEVYDSNHESSVMAGLIQGSCKVLPPVNYKEETERRSQLTAEINNKSEPVFLCKWFFDKLRGSFQPVFS